MSADTFSRTDPVSRAPHPPSPDTYWLTVAQAATHANCGRKSIYNAVACGKLRAARLGGRKELRFLREWIDEWLTASSTPVRVN